MKTHVILNYAEHDFHLPIIPNLERKPAESDEAFAARVKDAMEMRPGESREDFETRMTRQSILFPKFVHPRGEPGDKGYTKGGPTETTITDEQLQHMRKHRIASKWFGRDIKAGQGLELKQSNEDKETPAKGKAA